jgi:transcriptional regulator with XRE-family HTH domain
MTETNPVRETRERLGLSRDQLAVALDRSCAQVSAIERFALPRLAPGLRGGFEALGVDFDALSKCYVERRAAMAVEVRKAASHG